jgi:hypothetical protein
VQHANRRSLVDGITADTVFATITAAMLAEVVVAAVAPQCEALKAAKPRLDPGRRL